MCKVDQQFSLEACAKADEILGGDKFAPGYKRKHFEGCSHGFAVCGDMSDPKVKAGKEGPEGAFKAAVEWIKEVSRNTSKTSGGGKNPVADRKSTMYKQFVDVK